MDQGADADKAPGGGWGGRGRRLAVGSPGSSMDFACTHHAVGSGGCFHYIPSLDWKCVDSNEADVERIGDRNSGFDGGFGFDADEDPLAHRGHVVDRNLVESQRSRG